MAESGTGAPEPAKGGEEGEDLTLTFSYDARGRLCRAEDGKGACVRYAYHYNSF